MTKTTMLSAGLGALLAFAACGDSTGPGSEEGPGPGEARLSIGFQTALGGSAAVAPAGDDRISRNVAARSMTLTGSNGELTLDEIWLIVAEFELERAFDGDCFGESGGDNDACEKFQGPPQFLPLPLDGGETPAVSQDVPADVYDELELEIEDLELDGDEDNATAAELQALFASIREQFPDWPRDASMLVIGSFTPTGGTAVPFRVFFEAEVEIELEFQPPLNLTEGATATATVVVDPALWFRLGDGTVQDLSQFTGQLVEFEAEIENGFFELEWDELDD
ncbi:MAG: hypothetical protein R3266_05140 [Gemmatimonadota bacterium]|nr:hypothetical protein [Gemmatimonadota bacterium]